MKKVKWKGGALIAPLPPVLVTCGTIENPNALTIAWTGITNTIPPKTYISVRPSRHSYELIKESGEFVINLTTSDMVFATDYCGVRSGKNENKIEKVGLTVSKCDDSECIIINESPLSIECKVTDIVKLGSHDMFLADINSVYVNESLIDNKGALHLENAGLLAYAHGAYFELGKKLGTFGFSVRKKPINRKKRKNK